MKKNLIDQLAFAFKRLDHDRLSWMGQPLPFPSTDAWLLKSTEERFTFQHKQLSDVLYSFLYVHGEVRSLESRAPLGNGSLTESFQTVIHDQGFWEKGWHLESREEDFSMMTKDHLTLQVPNRETRQAELGYDVLMPTCRDNVSPGYYSIVGEVGSCNEDDQIIRFYFHVGADSAAQLAATIVSGVNELGVPFFFKILNDSEQFGRADAAVLYVNHQFQKDIVQFLEESWPKLNPMLEHGTPAFTLELAPGIGLAEDPGNGESFGEHRCHILASALLEYTKPANQLSLANHIENAFEKEHIHIESPYQSVMSNRTYEPLRIPTKPANLIGQTTESNEVAQDMALLDMATAYGDLICDHAVWYQDTCNWVTKNIDAPRSVLAKAMEADIYEGAAGLCWFFTELYSETNNPVLKEVASGAAKCILQKTASYMDKGTFSFYDGATGIIATALLVSKACEFPELEQQARAQALLLDETMLNQAENDLLSGLAGQMFGLMAIQHFAPDLTHLPELIESHADLLLERAEWLEGKASWKNVNQNHPSNLLGMSHGTSGIALALMQTANTLNTDKYNSLIQAAFAYEDDWRIKSNNLWPDLRYQTNAQNDVVESTLWCHGAPGISLCRNYAHGLGYLSYDSQSVLNQSYKATVESIEEYISAEKPALCVCHGLTGNAMTLIDSPFLSQRIIEQTSARLLNRLKQAQSGHDFSQFGYFTGLAGMGHYLLCAHQKRMSPLVMPVVELLPNFTSQTELNMPKEQIENLVTSH